MHLKAQSGNIMVELLLAVGVLSVLGGWMLRQQGTNGDDSRAKAYTETLATVRDAGANFYMANQSAILAATQDGTGAATICRVNINPADGTGGTTANNTTKNTCAVDTTFLKYSGFLPMSFSDTTPEGSRWVIIYKRARDGALNLTSNVEMLALAATTVGAVTVAPAPYLANKGSALEKAVTAAGGAAGVVPGNTSHPCGWVAADPTQQHICGAGGAWKATVSDFMN